MSKYNRVWTVDAQQVPTLSKAEVGIPAIHNHDETGPVIQRDRHGNVVSPSPGQWIVTHADGGFEVIEDTVFQVNYAPVVEQHVVATDPAPETTS